jgi:cytochrome c biogenesis DsbD-like protein
MHALFAGFLLLQSLLFKTETLQHIDVVPSVSAATVAKGGTVTLWADVTPKPNIHVYATDKYGFSPVSLVFGVQPRVTFGKVKYPTPEGGLSPGTDMLIPMYSKPFRLTQTATLSPSAKSGDVITISGAVNYEACNDRLCFPATSFPVTWVVTVK